MQRFGENAMSFYIRDLSVHRFWYLLGPGTSLPHKLGTTVYILNCTRYYQFKSYKVVPQFWRKILLGFPGGAS